LEGPSGEGTPFTPELLEWGREHLKKVAARFPQRYREELTAELGATLIKLKYRPPPGIRNWKAYLATCLSNRAISLVNKWRAHEQREISSEFVPDSLDPLSSSEELTSRQLEGRQLLSRARRVLDAKSYALLKLLADCNNNQSRVARLQGVHRNTIRRRLQKIRRFLLQCPIENVTGRFQLTPKQRIELGQMAQGGNHQPREVFKARLILALASGLSYARITQLLRTTRPTIARWKHRFQKHGIDGLKARHHGRKPHVDTTGRLANWLRIMRRTGKPSGSFSCRKIAKALAIGKSTVQRILRTQRIRRS
jgi:RNA polymerase sigma factor (sigma-70 family)